MNQSFEYSRENFLNTAHNCGLSPEGPYQDVLFAYVKNMLERNAQLYEIDASGIEPMSMVDCIVKDKK